MKVYVLSYSHKHGTDVSVYRFCPSAWKAAAQICVEQMDAGELDQDPDGGKVKKKIRKAWKAGEWLAVTEAWREIYQEEYFEVEERELHD